MAFNISHLLLSVKVTSLKLEPRKNILARFVSFMALCKLYYVV